MATRIKQVTFRRLSQDLVVEIDTMRDYITFLQDEGETLGALFGEDMEAVVESVSTLPIATVTTTEVREALATEGTPAAATEAPAKRTRGPNKKVEAIAPPPMPVPSAPPSPPSPPSLAIPADGGIPAALRRDPATNTAPALVAPPAPPMPPAVQSPPPISGPVTARVVAELTKRASTSPDGGAALVAWMAHPATGGFVVPGASFEEAVAVLHQLGDARVGALLVPLGLAA